MTRRRGDGPDPAHLREFEEFFLAQRRATVRCLLPLVRDFGEAEDLAMIAFERAAADWTTVRQYDDPAGWVRRVAFNEAMSWLRRARHRRVEYVPEPPSWAVHHDVYDHDTPELLLTLRSLPHRDRVVLTLHYVWGLTVEEAADHLGARPNTVKAQLARARQRLALVLKAAGHPASSLERSSS